MESGSYQYGHTNAQVASILVRLGEHDETFDRLEKAYEIREQELAMTVIMPDFDPVRSHTRFKALLKKMNIPESAA